MKDSFYRHIVACRQNLEEEEGVEEIIEYLNEAEKIFSDVTQTPKQLQEKLQTLMQTVKNKQRECEEMCSENQTLGWTFSSSRANVDYQKKIDALNSVRKTLEIIQASMSNVVPLSPFPRRA